VLDAYIIEEIKRQEEERRRRSDAARPRVTIEIPGHERPAPREPGPVEGEDDEDAPVIRIELRASGAAPARG
jgi:hypothetical protein